MSLPRTGRVGANICHLCPAEAVFIIPPHVGGYIFFFGVFMCVCVCSSIISLFISSSLSGLAHTSGHFFANWAYPLSN